VCFFLVCLCPVSCVSNVASFSGLSILGVVGNSIFFNVYLKHCKDSWNQQIHSKLHGIHSSMGKLLCFYVLNHNDWVVLTKCRTIHGRLTNSYLLNKEEWSECFPSNSNYSLKHIIIDCVDVKHKSINQSM
jgi:hypothetical protein